MIPFHMGQAAIHERRIELSRLVNRQKRLGFQRILNEIDDDGGKYQQRPAERLIFSKESSHRPEGKDTPGMDVLQVYGRCGLLNLS